MGNFSPPVCPPMFRTFPQHAKTEGNKANGKAGMMPRSPSLFPKSQDPRCAAASNARAGCQAEMVRRAQPPTMPPFSRAAAAPSAPCIMALRDVQEHSHHHDAV
jgi:hypothetical protein